TLSTHRLKACWKNARSCSRPCGERRTDASTPQLGFRRLLGAVRFTQLVELPNFAFTFARHLEEVLGQFDGFLLGVRLQQSKAADDFLRLDERPIGDGYLIARTSNARAQSARQTSLGAKQPALLHPLLDELAHGVHFLLGRGRVSLGVFIDTQEFHDLLSLYFLT